MYGCQESGRKYTEIEDQYGKGIDFRQLQLDLAHYISPSCT